MLFVIKLIYGKLIFDIGAEFIKVKLANKDINVFTIDTSDLFKKRFTN